MKFFPRSSWTAVLPTPFREYHPTLPFFLETPKVEFCVPNENYLYLYTNPVDALVRLQANISHLSDINYNYALPSNEYGCYTIRGANNKCLDSENLRVLLLIGKYEDPSDVLKTNQQDFLNSEHYLEPPGQFFDDEATVHVFDLAEYLGWLGYFSGPNYGRMTDTLHTAIEVYQYLNGFPVTGEWDELTAKATLMDDFVPRDRNNTLRTSRPPVGTYLNAQG